MNNPLANVKVAEIHESRRHDFETIQVLRPNGWRGFDVATVRVCLEGLSDSQDPTDGWVSVYVFDTHLEYPNPKPLWWCQFDPPTPWSIVRALIAGALPPMTSRRADEEGCSTTRERAEKVE